ncbi:MAG: ATP-binding cassette domain-containing protein [Actinomycetota bacterium]
MTDHSTDETREVLLRATDVHVTYRTYLDGRVGLRRRLRQGLRSGAPRYKDVRAVQGVDLELYRGEAVGLVGSNGSGKSSLLTGLAGLIELERGHVEAVTRPSLLGVGAALNRRLSGRRNIEIGCMALGLSKADVDERMESIVEFTGLGDSIDLPMNTYSSGMRARLVFTIATELEPEILFIDEALAVGDRTFRRRATERIQDMASEASSIVVVSHNLAEITRMCTRVVWLDQGTMVMDGETDEVLDAYKAAFPDDERRDTKKAKRKARRLERGKDKLRAQRRAAHDGEDESSVAPADPLP